MPEHDADDRLAVAGTGDAPERAVGVGPAADQRAVADASGKLAGCAAGRRRGRDRSVTIEGDGAHRATARRDGPARELRVTLALAIGDERGRIALRDSGGAAERLGAVTDEQNVAARLEDAPGRRDGIRDADNDVFLTPKKAEVLYDQVERLNHVNEVKKGEVPLV